jgi:hypothetical protein
MRAGNIHAKELPRISAKNTWNRAQLAQPLVSVGFSVQEGLRTLRCIRFALNQFDWSDSGTPLKLPRTQHFSNFKGLRKIISHDLY